MRIPLDADLRPVSDEKGSVRIGCKADTVSVSSEEMLVEQAERLSSTYSSAATSTKSKRVERHQL